MYIYSSELWGQLAMSVLAQLDDLPLLQIELEKLDPERRLARLEMKRVIVSDTAHLEVLQALHEVVPSISSRPHVCLITDKTPIIRDGRLLLDLVLSQIEGECEVRLTQLTSTHGGLHADEDTLEQAALAANSNDVIITIGSGTITDIGKVAAARNERMPHIAIQTAASVDGFTDNVSVVLKSGVKRTIPSAWPSIVLADVETIAGAPREMNVAGFGEALSLFTAPADWYLSHLLGLDRSYHSASMKMLKTIASQPPNWSSGIANGEKSSIKELTKLLALRGIVSGVSNTTACLSGVEHVISHMLDLHHAAIHESIGLHGEQVGIASIIASRLWRQAIEYEIFDIRKLEIPDLSEMHRRIQNAFGHLDTDGKLADECWRDYQLKHKLLLENWQNVLALVDDWKNIKSQFETLVTPAETMASALIASGGPIHFNLLSKSISDDLALWAVNNCHLMRNRFNLVDLLDLMGLWTPERIQWAMMGLVGKTNEAA